MPIEGGLRNKLAPGTTLIAKYKGKEHMAEVIAAKDGTVRYRLADGRDFASPSAAGKAVMGGIACNGWRFWSLVKAGMATKATRAHTSPDSAPEGDQPPVTALPAPAAKRPPTGAKAGAAKPATGNGKRSKPTAKKTVAKAAKR